MRADKWTREQLKLAFHLYCQLPFGKLHQRHPEIVELAGLIGRTPSAVAMKLVNFASLDPAVTGTGRKGLGNASSEDRAIWAEFNADWDSLATEADRLRDALEPKAYRPVVEDIPNVTNYAGETRATLVELRLKQAFFRRAVLSSYGSKCCMSGIGEPRLLTASHIIPWSVDRANRLNPRNGLCLSALHDRAFDAGLITVSSDMRIEIAASLLAQSEDRNLKAAILDLRGRQIVLPERFVPDSAFLEWHRTHRFDRPAAPSAF